MFRVIFVYSFLRSISFLIYFVLSINFYLDKGKIWEKFGHERAFQRGLRKQRRPLLSPPINPGRSQFSNAGVQPRLPTSQSPRLQHVAQLWGRRRPAGLQRAPLQQYEERRARHAPNPGWIWLECPSEDFDTGEEQNTKQLIHRQNTALS